jgi:hypothetical protein
MLNTAFNLMSSKKQDPTVYLDPVTSQYYTNQIYTPSSQNNMGGGYMGMNRNMGLASIYGNRNNNYAMPQTRRNYTGQMSVVNQMMQNRQPYQYNAPSVASMFPSMAMPMMNFNQGTGGASQFLGGLLGNSPMLSQGNAPASSGAGRFA